MEYNSRNFVIALLIILIAIATFVNKNKMEHLDVTTSPLNSEAIQNIASVYNTSNMKVTNLSASGTLTAGTTTLGTTTLGNTTINGTFNIIPRGVIVMWNGSTVPAGWALCNGQNGTPNLKDRFVLSSGSQSVNTLGGAATVKLSVANLPAHSHGFGVGGGNGNENSGETGIADGWSKSYSSAKFKNKTTETGSGAEFGILPPYYVLAFIMKL